MAALEFLNSLGSVRPEISVWCDELSDLYQRQSWSDLGEKLLDFSDLECFQTGDDFIQLYDNFISHVELNISHISLAYLAMKASSMYQDKEAAIYFLKGVIENLQSIQETLLDGSVLYINLQIATYYLQKGNHREARHRLENGATTLGSSTVIEDVVYAYYYWVSCQYHWFIKNPAELYRCAILCTKYDSLENLSSIEEEFFARNLLVAALLVDNIYNFGELLELPIMKGLIGSPIEWIYQILEAFNSGDLVGYQKLSSANETVLLSTANHICLGVGTDHQKKMLDKLNVVRLMEFIFSIPSEDRRSIPLSDIARHMTLTVEVVEHLLMKSLSAGLMKGTIDQVDQTVDVSWVKPRVLRMDQVESVRHQVVNWLGKVKGVTVSVETGKPEFDASYNRFLDP